MAWRHRSQLDAAGKVEMVIEAGLILQVYQGMREAMGLPDPAVIVDV